MKAARLRGVAVRAVAASALAALAVLSCALVTPASAAPEELPVSIGVEELAPLAPVATDTLSIRGAVANRSESMVSAVTVRLRMSRSPLPDRMAIAAVESGTLDSTGTIVDNTRTLPVDQLYPGQSSPFSLSVPISALGLDEPGVYLLVLEAQTDPGDGNLQRSGLLRTYLPWFPAPGTTPVTGVVTLWPLSAAPAVDSDGVLLDDDLPRALLPGGRLRVLLDAGGARPEALTWLVDPALLQTVDSMGDGYRVRVDGEIEVGPEPDLATGWLDDLRRTTARADVMSLPYAVPDDVALVRAGLGREVVRSITSAAPTAGRHLLRPIPSVLAWPTTGLADKATLRTLADAGPRAVLLSASQLRNAEPYTPSGLTTIPGSSQSQLAVVPDGVLSSILSSAHPTDSDIVLARQRLLAELAVIGLEIAAPRTMVVGPPVGWTSSSAFLLEYLRAVSSVPWIRPTQLSALLGGEPATASRTLTAYSAKAQRAELSPAYTASIGSAQDAVDTVAEVVSSSGELTRPLASALDRAPSGWFRKQRAPGVAIVTQVRSTAAATLGGVRIISKGAVTLPGDTGIIPLSISNTLDRAVTVSLAFDASPSVRLSAGPVAPVRILPGATTLVEVPARVSGSEPVVLTVRLASSDGSVFGEPAELRVGTSAYSRAATWVVAAAFGILVLLLGVNGWRRIRQARRPQPRAVAAAADDTMVE